MSTIIGLSLGNTTSSVAYSKDGKLEVIANPDGDRAIPSMLAYAHGDELHGSQAKQQLVRNAKNTIAYFRDYIGVNFDKIDPTLCENSAHPVDLDGQVGFKTDIEAVSVNDLAVRLLKHLKHAAEDYIGKPVEGCVLGVPSNFGSSKRSLVESLAAQAGLPILQVVNEVSASLLAHVSRPDLVHNQKDQLFVVADFGGTRSDGAVVANNGGIFTILATLHDPELGGVQLDEALVEHLCKEFEKQFSVDPRGDARALAKLRAEAEHLKKTLSNSSSAQFGVESLTQGIDFTGTLNRLRFEVAARPVIARMTAFVEELVNKAAALDVLEIDQVLLAGGTARVPKLAASVASLFDEKRTTVVAPSLDARAVEPDELVCRGCAIQGTLIAGHDADEVRDSQQAIVTNGPHLAHGVGYLDENDKVVLLLAPNTLVPLRKSFKLESGGESLLRIVEVHNEVKVTKPEPKPQAEQDSDWSDEEEEEIREFLLVPGDVLAEVAVRSVGSVDLVVDVTRDLKLKVAVQGPDTKVSGVCE